MSKSKHAAASGSDADRLWSALEKAGVDFDRPPDKDILDAFRQLGRRAQLILKLRLGLQERVAEDADFPQGPLALPAVGKLFALSQQAVAVNERKALAFVRETLIRRPTACGQGEIDEELRRKLLMPTAELRLAPRTSSWLVRSPAADRVHKLLELGRVRLQARVFGIGPDSILEIEQALAEIGLSFDTPVPPGFPEEGA